VDQVHQSDSFAVPTRNALGHAARMQVHPLTDGSDDIASGIEQRDAGEFAWFDQLVHRGFETFLRDDAAETALRAHHQPERIGNVLGAIDKCGARGLPNAGMLGELPCHERSPNGKQDTVNQPGAPGHAFIVVGGAITWNVTSGTALPTFYGK